MKKLFRYLAGWGCLLVLSQMTAAEDVVGVGPQDGAAITSPEQAVAKVLAYTGLDKMKDFRAGSPEEIVTLVTVRDSTTPFLSDSIDGRRCWLVTFEDVWLHLDSTRIGQELDRPKTFWVYLDSLTGRFLKARFRIKGDTTTLFREPTAKEATELISALGEKYHSIPATVPTFTLWEALRECAFHPLLAKEIIIHYVVYSRNMSANPRLDLKPKIKPSPAWAIYMRGMPPQTAQGGVDYYMVSNRRTVVDASRGYKYITCNIPYPRIEEGKRE